MKKLTAKNKGIKLVRKSNDLIEARYKFDIWETRVFTKVLTLIRPEDGDFQTFRIYLRDVIEDFELQTGNASYQLLRDASDSLMKKAFYVPYEAEDGVIRERKYPIIIMSDTLKSAQNEQARVKNEYIELSIHPDMKPFLLELKEKFTSYDIKNIIRFKSNYTLRIYEHLKQYERIGRRTIEIDYLKRIFELTTEYPLFANFYQKIIEPAERDINLYTDLSITKIGKIKRSKKVEALYFEFHRKEANEPRKLKSGAENTPLSIQAPAATTPNLFTSNAAQTDALFLQFQAKVVTEFGVSPTVFLGALSGKTEADVEKAIRITEGGKTDGKVKNVAGFFVEALRQNFTSPAEEKKQKQRQKAENQKKIADFHQKVEALRDEQADAIFLRIKDLTADDPNLTEDAIAAIRLHPFKRKVIESHEDRLQRPMTTQDFRSDKAFRQMVIETIFELNVPKFTDITERIGEEIRKIEGEIRVLQQLI